MAMGKRKRERQPGMWVAATDFPTAASHPFDARLNQLLREHGFDDARGLIYKEVAAIWNQLGRWMPSWPMAITVAARA